MKALFATMALLPALASAAETVGLLQVQPPPNWARSTMAGGARYRSPPDAAGADCRISVLPPRRASGDASASFAEAWTAATAGTPVATRAPTPELRPWREGWQSASAALTGTRSQLWLVTLNDGTRVQAVLASGPADCRDAFVAFFDALAPAQPTALAPASSAAADAASGLVGLWSGFKTTTMEIANTPYGPHAFRNTVTRLVPYKLLLLPDGTYTEHPPPGGLHDPSLQQGAARRGRYTVAADGQALLLHGTSPSAAPRSVNLRDGVPCTDHGPMRRRP